MPLHVSTQSRVLECPDHLRQAQILKSILTQFPQDPMSSLYISLVAMGQQKALSQRRVSGGF